MIKHNPNRDGYICTEYKTIHNIVSSAAEAETCETSKNRNISIGMRTTIIFIGPQTTSNTPQNRKFYNRGICKLRQETKTLKNIGYEMAMVERQGGA